MSRDKELIRESWQRVSEAALAIYERAKDLEESEDIIRKAEKYYLEALWKAS